VFGLERSVGIPENKGNKSEKRGPKVSKAENGKSESEMESETERDKDKEENRDKGYYGFVAHCLCKNLGGKIGGYGKFFGGVEKCFQGGGKFNKNLLEKIWYEIFWGHFFHGNFFFMIGIIFLAGNLHLKWNVQ
jgi:hypothetical protein